MHTCLIVTSEGPTQREFCAMVRMLGFEAACASSISEAKDMLRHKPLAVVVIDEWWQSGEDPMHFVRSVPLRGRPPVVVVQKVRLAALNNGADYAVHRDDPSHLRDVLAEIELKAHEQAALAEEVLPQAAE